MKKLSLILLLVCLSFTLFAQTDVRSYGMGGTHITDTSDFYTIDRNPAGLGFTSKHNLWTNLQVDVNGPLKDIIDASKDLILNTEEDDSKNTSEENKESEAESSDDKENKATEELTNLVMDLVKQNNGLFTGINIVGPINFGFIKNGFGLKFSENIKFNLDVASVQNAQIKVVANTDLTIAYGHKIDLGAHDIGLGVSASLYTSPINVGIQDSLVNIMNLVTSEEDEKTEDQIPMDIIYGYGFDIGLQYRFANNFTFGAVLKDVGTKYICKVEDNKFNFDKDKAVKQKLEPTLAVGFGVKIPTEYSFGLITSWTAYADYDNVFNLLPKNKEKLARNPLLGLSAGTEVVLFKTIALRAGINESYLSAGLGVKLAAFHIDFALFGTERSLEPGLKPQMNAAFSVSFHN